MLATDRRAGLRRIAVLALCAVSVIAVPGIAPLQAHPMPDTEITLTRSGPNIALDIKLPLSDLLLVLPPKLSRDAQTLVRRDQAGLRAYFAEHTRLLVHGARDQHFAIGTITLHRDSDEDVGSYAEIEVKASAQAAIGTRLALAYDAVLHKVANKRAIVRDAHGHLLGIIRYSLADKRAKPLQLPPL